MTTISTLSATSAHTAYAAAQGGNVPPRLPAGSGAERVPASASATVDGVAAGAAQQKAQASEAQVRKAAQSVVKEFKYTVPHLQFAVDQDTGRTVIKVIDPDSKGVIRQIPPEEILRISEAIDQFQGRLLESQA